ncbi:hypothetical protein KPL42_15175 [Clostridium gasigenes]|uniref:hypothetical protein n=1 Tax=Clostridium gasigenes TaxID=94869 RepID=UPI001C0C6569|nr:hypothetical protein [Clostridium gasigenes]MBU3089826.1 hypothetical protein [Clostridium gasigenes]
MVRKVLIDMRVGGENMYIGILIKERMKALGISKDELVENSFVDEEIIDKLLDNKQSISEIDVMDMEFISETLYCKLDYFLDENVRKKDVLNNSLNRGSKSIKSNNVKVKIQDVMENFEMLYTIYEESGV